MHVPAPNHPERAPQLVAALRLEIQEAWHRLAPYALRTPVVRSQCREAVSNPPWLKCENLQRAGSFKMRGALNKVLSLSAESRARGLVAASTGNHGLALAEALRLIGGHGTVVVSAGAASYKRERLAAAGMRVVVVDGDALAAECAARAMAERDGLVYISPYNDLDVVAGQGTVGMELSEQLPEAELVFVPVGGGGLIAGVAAALQSHRPAVRIVGCWAERAPAMYEAMRAGRAVDVEDQPTLADATTGGLEADALTIPLCRALVDECVLVSEREILRAMRDTVLTDHLVVEGAAGVAVAGYRQYLRARPEHVHRPAVIVLCGGQVGADLLVEVLRDDTPTTIDAGVGRAAGSAEVVHR